jgi:hypothetical protein
MPRYTLPKAPCPMSSPCVQLVGCRPVGGASGRGVVVGGALAGDPTPCRLRSSSMGTSAPGRSWRKGGLSVLRCSPTLACESGQQKKKEEVGNARGAARVCHIAGGGLTVVV